MPKQPPHLKIQRAKVIVDDEGKKVRTTCESCGTDVYLLEGQTLCSECISKRRFGELRNANDASNNSAVRSNQTAAGSGTSTALQFTVSPSAELVRKIPLPVSYCRKYVTPSTENSISCGTSASSHPVIGFVPPGIHVTVCPSRVPVRDVSTSPMNGVTEPSRSNRPVSLTVVNCPEPLGQDAEKHSFGLNEKSHSVSA